MPFLEHLKSQVSIKKKINQPTQNFLTLNLVPLKHMILFVLQIESAIDLADGNCAIIYTSSCKVFTLCLTALVGGTIVTKSMCIHIEKKCLES